MQDLTPEPLGPAPIPRTALQLRTVFAESAQYALGGLAYKAIALLSVPVLARLLIPAELGLLDAAVVIAMVVSIIAGAGLENALARLEAESTNSGELWGSALLILAIGALALGLSGVVASDYLAGVIMGDEELGPVVAAGVVYGCGLAFTTAGLNAIRLRNRPRRYAAYGFVIVTAEMLAALALAAVGAPVATIVLGWVGVSVVGGVVLLIREVPPLRRPSTLVVRRLFSFGMPLVPAAVVWIVGDLGIRSLLAHGSGLTALGLYGIAGRLTSVIQLAITGFALSWHPFLYRSAGDVSALGRGAAISVVAGLGILGCSLSAIAPEAIRLVAGPAYEDAAAIVPGLAAAMMLFGLVAVATAVLGVGYAVREVAVASGFGAILQLAIAWPLIESLGVAGAGVAAAAGYALTAALLVMRAGITSPKLIGVTANALVALAIMDALQQAVLPVRLIALGVATGTIVGVWRLLSDASK
jgi:O-antigen/teichoic acid export membrane protein